MERCSILLRGATDVIRGGPGTAVAQFAPISFDVSAQEILSALTSGKTLNLLTNDTRRDPEALWSWLAERRVQELFVPNLVIESLCEVAAERIHETHVSRSHRSSRRAFAAQ